MAVAATTILLGSIRSVEAQRPVELTVVPGLVLDGHLNEWSPGDAPEVGLSRSGRFVTLALRLPEPLLLQSEGEVELVLTPSATSRAVRWRFSARAGQGPSGPLSWPDLDLRAHPAHRAAAFEVAMGVGEVGRLLDVGAGDPVRVEVEDAGRSLLSVVIAWPDPDARRANAPPSQPSAGAVRLVSWNLESSGLFDPHRRASVARLLGALDPDIVVLQEVYDSAATAVANTLDEMLPDDSGRAWKVRKSGDVAIAARDSLGRAVDLGFHDYGRVVAVPWHTASGPPVLVFGAHLPCCTGGVPPADRRRAFLLDQIAEVVHSVVGGESPWEDEFASIVLAGDLNLVGEADALRPLIDPLPRSAGRPAGPSFRLLPATHLDGEETFTWISDGSAYVPGRLDFILMLGEDGYEVESVFVFDDADAAESEEAGLAKGFVIGDVRAAGDHLPLVLDLRPVPVSALGAGADPRTEER